LASGAKHGEDIVAKPTRRQRESDRRTTVERYHELADATEQYEIDRAVAGTIEERQQIANDFSAFRRARRLEDVRRGKRPEGTSVMMRRVLWSTWAAIAGEHLQRAREHFARIAAGDATVLELELRESLEATGAAVATIEALYEELVYLVPKRTQRFDERHEEVVDLLEAALGLDTATVATLRDRLEPLYDARHGALHPYSELLLPMPHPAGIGATGAEHSTYNAIEAEAHVATALAVLDLAASPPHAANRWVSRWCEERAGYFKGPIAEVRAGAGL
jgi:hypothetical protein